MKKVGCFKIQILQNNNEQPTLSKMIPIHQIMNSRFSLYKEPVVIEADPFLFVKGDTLHLFYESKKQYHDGVIKMICTKDLQKWTKPVVVLSEDFHLSYPWVFERDGHIYMVPETCAADSVRLYETENDQLTHFRFVKTILLDTEPEIKEFSFSDTSIHEYKGYYYLFTTVKRNGKNELQLYLSESFYGPFREHPMSPISIDQRFARNAGCLFKHKDKFIRVAQDCSRNYGDNVNILEIDQLSPTEYREHLVQQNYLDTNDPFYRYGGHQLNMIKFSGKWILATDAKEYHPFLWNRILHKLGLYRY